MSTKGVGSGGDQTLDLETTFPLGWGEAQEVQDELTQDGEVLSGVIGTGAPLVIAKDHVHAPVQTVFDAPVLADGLTHALRVGCVHAVELVDDVAAPDFQPAGSFSTTS